MKTRFATRKAVTPYRDWHAWALRHLAFFGRRPSAHAVPLSFRVPRFGAFVLLERSQHTTLLHQPVFVSPNTTLWHAAAAIHAHFTTRLQTTVVQASRVFVTLPGLEPPAERVASLRAPASSTHVRHTRDAHTAHHHFLNTVTRHYAERTQVTAPPSTHVLNRSERVTLPGSLERTLTLRRDVITTAPAAAAVPPRAQETARSVPQGVAPAAAMHPGIDVEYLTNQVIQQIDRRVVARRERMGRV